MARAKTLTIAIVIAVGAYVGAKRLTPGPAPRAKAVITSLPMRPAPETPAAAWPAATPAPSVAPPQFVLDEEPWTGVLLAQSVDLTARIDSRVKALNYKVGDSVRTGDAVAELDTTSQQLEVSAAEASVRASRAEQWSASLQASQAREKANRRGQVIKFGGVSVEEFSDSKFDSMSASSRASAAGAQAQERMARLAHLKQTIAEATLRATFDGVVATRFVDSGAHVQPGQAVVRVVGRGRLRVRFAVPEAEATGITLRTRVALEWDLHVAFATVDRIAPEVEMTTSSLIMEAELDASAPQDQSALAGRVVGVRLARMKTQR